MFLGGVLGTVGAGLLASCGNAAGAVSAGVSCASKLNLPIKVPPARSGEVISKVPNVPVAWTKYPKPYVTMPGGPPGKGGSFTTFQINYNPPPPPLDQNPWWQKLNKNLGAAVNPILAPDADYVTKFSTLEASGNFPDLTYVNFNPHGYYEGAAFMKLLAQGAFHNLTDYLTGSGLKKFPNLQLISAASWRGSSFEGKIWGVPTCIEPVDGELPLYRKDWAEKLGVDNPRNSTETLKMLSAFANGHPNGAGKQTWGLSRPHQPIWNSMFNVANNWRLNKDGSLQKDMETEEYSAATDFARQLWKAGVFWPNALTGTLSQENSLFEGGAIGMFMTGGVGEFGKQPGTVSTLTIDTDPKANPQPWMPVGHSGGPVSQIQGPASFGFAAIPTSIKSDSRIEELLHICEYYAAPFGSTEYNFMTYGIEGKTFHYVDGNPVPVSNGNQTWLYLGPGLCGPNPVYYFANQPGEAQFIQGLQEKQIQQSVTDPTVGVYSQTWVEQAANLINLQTNTYYSVISGQQPFSALKDSISTWKSQGGDQARKEYEQALKKCEARM